MLLIYFKTDENSIFDIHNPIGIKVLSRLRPNFSHLNAHKFCHIFRDTVNTSYLCNAKIETTSHYLLHCPLFSEQKTKLFENLGNLDNTLLNNCDDDLLNILLYGSSTYSFSTNNKIMSLTVEVIESTKCFDKPLFWIVSTSNGHMTLFQRRQDVYVLSATSCRSHVNVGTMSCVQLAAVHI